jgi:hypothetical protein
VSRLAVLRKRWHVQFDTSSKVARGMKGGGDALFKMDLGWETFLKICHEPIVESTHEFAVVIVGKIEVTFGTDRADGQAATQSLQSRQGLKSIGLLSLDCTERNETAVFWMDDEAMQSHLTQSGRDGDGLVRDNPDAAWKPVHLNGGECFPGSSGPLR